MIIFYFFYNSTCFKVRASNLQEAEALFFNKTGYTGLYEIKAARSEIVYEN